MTKEYGAGAPLSYNKYLRVPDLIALQDCLSDPAHHDELLFITIHQAYELWFKQVLHELDAAVSALAEDRAVLRAFRDDEFASRRLGARFDAPTLADAFFALLARRGLDAPPDDPAHDEEERRRRYGKRTRAVLEVITHFESRYEEFLLAEAMIAHDEYFSLWRSHHVKMVERMVGSKPGTGGSEGVGYLRTTLDKRFFPEMWEARTHLDAKHGGAAGCPFAK